MATESLRTVLLLSLIAALTWVATGAVLGQPSEASPAFGNDALCIHRPAH